MQPMETCWKVLVAIVSLCPACAVMVIPPFLPGSPPLRGWEGWADCRVAWWAGLGACLLGGGLSGGEMVCGFTGFIRSIMQSVS